MTQDDIAYYRQRARREMELAQEARHPRAADAHTLLAHHYLGIVEAEVVRPFPGPKVGLGMLSRTK